MSEDPTFKTGQNLALSPSPTDRNCAHLYTARVPGSVKLFITSLHISVLTEFVGLTNKNLKQE